MLATGCSQTSTTTTATEFNNVNSASIKSGNGLSLSVSLDAKTYQSGNAINIVITEYAIPTLNNTITNGITAGSDGSMWFALGLEHKIGKISPETGTITEYPINN